LGYPRIGENRELKWLLESYWEGKTGEEELLNQAYKLEEENWRRQRDLGVEILPVGDFSLYDHMLDLAVTLDLVPGRFKSLQAASPLQVYFALARGAEGVKACALKKWFDTNYHYIVPEWEGEPRLKGNPYLESWERAQKSLGIKGKPVIPGPFTLVKLSGGYEDWKRALRSLVEPYGQLLKQLEKAGAEWVQMDEPALVLDLTAEEIQEMSRVYRELAGLTGIKIMLQTYFGYPSFYEEIIRWPVAGIGLDFVQGRHKNLEFMERYGFPPDKVLGAGVVNGRNVWRADLKNALSLVRGLLKKVDPERLWLQPSCSLIFLPLTTAREEAMPLALREGLSFAHERLKELRILKTALVKGEDEVKEELEKASRARESLAAMPGRVVPAVRERLASLQDKDFVRGLAYKERKVLQEKAFNLPLLPTTSIGSLPQTKEVRSVRARWRRGEISDEEYREFLQREIARWIKFQEEIGMDVLVHGEFERPDMVEFFAAKLPGFYITQNGWVQSYGSRCTKPPILYGDIWREQPLTVAEITYAQSLTAKPVKGIMTGPVTMMKWSFVRDDIPEEEIAYQLALALRDEIRELEEKGIRVIQVDEPALREALPLREESREAYLGWATRSFRLATSQVKPETQVHTHMCYGELGEVISAIEEMDVDVVSLEAARGGEGLLQRLQQHPFARGIGLGVFDVHSPYVPEADQMVSFLRRILKIFRPEQVWVNPDCGLKTRQEPETKEALERMVAAARLLREELAR